ncbi:TPA: DUF551 domain-containing protein [Salmonella enterica subsp. enterica serovar Ball]|nr:DUF551 domain-containing protein [Salmonella enterica subsp. enterica serovar Ball]HCA3484865.1 DUF551 domain-containing protein [Salmonella enterica subsp. enterica serovar Ball]HCA3563008.1 DUF551 domain-containing protein [Salmonella enterica subsp. enterica serovar Ball]
MTTITREQQKQILIDTANHVISRDNTSPYSENLRELARIALASLDAEPVAWECGENIILFNPDTVEAYAKRAEISPKPLYAAPPVSVTPDGWISCSERMPDREYVLAGDFSGTHYLASIPNVQVGIYADWFDDEKHCWDDGDSNDLHLKEVTHWMPLPEPPQEVK